MNKKNICLMFLILPLLVACSEGNGEENYITDRNIKDVSIYKNTDDLKTEEEDLITTFDKQEVQVFEDIIKNVKRTEEANKDKSSDYDIEFKYENGDINEIGLQLANKSEGSVFFYGYDSNSERRIYAVSPEQTSRLLEIINN